MAERRPLKARGLKIFKDSASALARFGVTPNQISIASIFFGCVGGYFFTQPGFLIWGAALGIQLRLLCNLMDGMVAVEHNRKTKAGELFNEVPDRVSDSAILIGLGFCPGVSLSLALAAALCAMFTAYIRVLGASMGANSHFTGPMAKQQRMALLTLLSLVGPFWPADGNYRFAQLANLSLWIIIAGCLLTVLRRLKRILADMNS